MFRATWDGKPVLVKFCETYGLRAHELLVAAGLAPELYFGDAIRGGVVMVVMELVAGHNAAQRFGTAPLPDSVVDDVRKAVCMLHEEHLVFGDLRRQNIMIRNGATDDPDAGGETAGPMSVDPRAMLVDFDWVGLDGQTRYPALLNNDGTIKWFSGIAPAAIMRKEHDVGMLGLLNSPR